MPPAFLWLRNPQPRTPSTAFSFELLSLPLKPNLSPAQVKTEALHAAVSHGYLRNMPPKAQREWDQSHHTHISPAKARPQPSGKNAAGEKKIKAAAAKKPAAKKSDPQQPTTAAKKPQRRQNDAPKITPQPVAAAYGPYKAAEHPSSLIMVRLS